MRAGLPVRAGHIETMIIVTPAPDVEMRDLLEEMRDLHNPILSVGERTITAVHQLDSFLVDHSEADNGELVWACEFCDAYSRTKAVTDRHEQTCNKRGS